MLRKLLITAVLTGFALSANAQIATQQLDAGFPTYGGAAAGWRFNSNVSIIGVSAEGKNEHDGVETGEVKAGLNAEGPDDSSALPFMAAAYRGETWAGELYTNLTNGLNYDAEIDLNAGLSFDTFNIYKEKKQQRLALAYIYDEMVSIGIGYKNTNLKTRTELAGTTSETQETKDLTTTGLSASISWRLAEIFFLAAGMESVTENGNYESASSSTAASDGGYVENTWTNTFYGIGLMSGDPSETQFRLEYSVISSPEAEADAEGDKAAAKHPETTHSFATIEAKFSGLLIAYQNETKLEKELDNVEKEIVTTMLGLGWQPRQGLMFSIYSWDRKSTLTHGTLGEIVMNPTGFKAVIGYNF